MYKINVGYRVNEHSSKNGIRWEYRGKVLYWTKEVEEWRKTLKSDQVLGIRVTDLETGKIVYEKVKS